MDLHHLLGAPVSEWRASARMSNRHRVQAAVSEFLHAWTCGGKASLHLDTSDGGCTVSFTAHLGHPGALLLPTPPPAAPFPRHRGRADRERNRQRAAAHQAAQRAAEHSSVPSSPVISSSAAVSAASAPAPVILPASASVAPISLAAPASAASTLATVPAASSTATVNMVSATSAPIMSTLSAAASVTSTPTSSSVRGHQACTSCGLPRAGHKGPLGRRCPALESLRDASVDSSLNASPDKGGEREVSCWNCEAPLTPTHQCEEVVDDSEGKDCDEGEWTEGCFYNPDSDPCGQCPSCLQKGDK